MKGRSCGLHPQPRMGKKSSPCGRTDSAVEVEDHDTGYVFIGCSDIEQARRILDEYVYDADDYRFAARLVRRDGKRSYCCVWLSKSPSAVWKGSK